MIIILVVKADGFPVMLAYNNTLDEAIPKMQRDMPEIETFTAYSIADKEYMGMAMLGHYELGEPIRHYKKVY